MDRSELASGLSTRCAISLAALLLASAAHADRYDIGSGSSTIVAHTEKTGFLSWTGAGHEHDVRAERFDGGIAFDPAMPESLAVEIVIAAGSLVVVDELGPDTRAKIQLRMETEILDIENHALITFVSTSTEVRRTPATQDWELRVRGSLTLRGTTRPVELPVRLQLDTGGLHARGELEIRQTDFGIEPVSVGLGAVRVKDELQVRFELNGTKVPEP